MAVTPVLERFDTYVYRDKNPPSDLAQVPANATVDFYKLGATVAAGVAVWVPYQFFDPIEIPVWHLGTFQAGDELLVDGDPAKQLHVVYLDTLVPSLWVENLTSPTSILVSEFQRLVRLTDRPLVYRDSTGQVSTGSPSCTTDATGRAWGYLREFRYDYVITGAGFTRRVFADAVGSFVLRE